MTRTSDGKIESRPARPVIRRTRWPLVLVWVAPVMAAVLAGYYLFDHLASRGPLITVTFPDATGLRVGQSQIMHLGIPLGEVEGVSLAADGKAAQVQIRLDKNASDFGRAGTLFWVVRPQISMEEISGLATVLSGPYIDAIPGAGPPQTEFTGLPDAPVTVSKGLRIILDVSRMGHMQANSPVYYRGIQVGEIEGVQLSSDASEVEVHAFINARFSPLVRTTTEFWNVSGIDVQGGLFSGVQMKLESLRSLISGGVEFATPDQNVGAQVGNGAHFILHDDAHPSWLKWTPHIPIQPDISTEQPASKAAGTAMKELSGH
ncbi:MAG TPA: MlaD family protein [Tepidisphaeraceae bacterium]|nr:MlaD family protein [Tepidisphaeraceae bacterium]